MTTGVQCCVAALVLGLVRFSLAQNTQAGSTKAALQDFAFVVQSAEDTLPLGADPENRLGAPLLKHLGEDQMRFWNSPNDLAHGGAKTFTAFAAFTGVLMASDHWITQQVPNQPNQLLRSQHISNYSLYSLVGTGGGAYLWGRFTGNDHLQEAGLLGGEAALNSTAIAYLMKQAAQRPRPYTGNGHGTFWQGGDSFPSEHSAMAWAVASVLAHEYPGTLTKVAAYGLASAVSLTRITGKQHFASDAVVGGVLGWYFGREVYRAHHDPELGGGPWGGVEWVGDTRRPRPENMASPYEPLDSWVYPALERLQALGYLHTAYLNQRPWTRLDCARMVEEAGEQIPPGDSADPVARIYEALAQEFAEESARLVGNRNLGVALDSIYTRVTAIAGPPLRDGFHFAQTVVNDYGRPYAEGWNTVSGLSASGEAGPLAFALRAEYQQAPAGELYPARALQAIAQADNIPTYSNPTMSVGQPRLLEAMVAFNFHNTQFSFGRQSAWLSPSRSSSLLLSNNAEPFLMLRIDSVTPYEVPGLSKLLGPMKAEFFIGQLSGQQFVFNGSSVLGPQLNPQPFIHGDRISFKPTPNLEVGMGITAMFGGPGLPFTWGNFLRTYYAHSPNTSVNPGKRFSAFDFSYRVPGLRKWLTLYTDSLVVDEITPLGSTRPSLNPGLYMPQFPKLHSLEFRIEGLKTSQAPHALFPPGYVYTDRRYLSGYTNDGNLLGSWMGRAGSGGQAWATYHYSARNSVEFSFRHMDTDHSFLQGGHLTDFSVQNQTLLRPEWSLSTLLQYEHWAFPLLTARPQSNVTVSFQLSFSPHSTNWARRLVADGAWANQQP